jgi:alkylhydroperoxidase/carboxymuconolactone decarboxylase family protein YurZ
MRHTTLAKRLSGSTISAAALVFVVGISPCRAAGPEAFSDAASNQEHKTIAVEQTLSATQQAIPLIAAFMATSDMPRLHAALNQGLDAGLSISEAKEILVQLYAYTGFPRSLNAPGELMKVLEERKQRGIQDAPGREPSRPVPTGDALLAAGTANQTKISGAPGSGGQWGGNCSTAGVYAACMKLREAVVQRLGLDGDADFAEGLVNANRRQLPIAQAAAGGDVVAEDFIEFGDLDKKFQQSTFGAHFVEVAVDSATGEIRVRRMLAVCASGRILNPKTARSQVIGAMTQGVGAALMEELVVDKRAGFFVNHDLAGYEVPVHADIPHQDAIFLDEPDAVSSPMKAKGVAELGICGVAAAIANAVYNATGVRVREYPITLDKMLRGLPAVA